MVKVEGTATPKHLSGPEWGLLEGDDNIWLQVAALVGDEQDFCLEGGIDTGHMLTSCLVPVCVSPDILNATGIK